MVISIQPEPKGARKIVHAAIHSKLLRKQMPSLGDVLHTANPLPIYRAAGKSLRTEALASARKIGWSFPLLSRTSPCLVQLARKPGGWKYAGISEGEFPTRVLEAAYLAESHLQKREHKYEARLLELPALRLRVLWLRRNNGKSAFVRLSEPETIPKLELVEYGSRTKPRALNAAVKLQLPGTSRAAQKTGKRPKSRSRRRPHPSS